MGVDDSKERIMHWFVNKRLKVVKLNQRLKLYQHIDNDKVWKMMDHKFEKMITSVVVKEQHRKERVESMQHVVAGQHGWVSRDKPGKFLVFKSGKCSMFEGSFYRQLVTRSETIMRQEEYKRHPRNVSWQMRCIRLRLVE